MDRFLTWWRGPAQVEAERCPAPLPFDRRVGGFEILEPLGDGGTATVYAARDEAGRDAAIKIPHQGVLQDREFVATFRREAELGVSLRHPSIVKVLAAGVYAMPDFPEIPYFAMELLRGRELSKILRDEGRLPQALAISIARAIADALDWAHQRGVVHRDISTSNVFLTQQRCVKVMDFGISAGEGEHGEPRRGMRRGTPEYLAPERVADFGLADPRVDLYALGCVLYEMLAGTSPFAADRPEEVLHQHVHHPVPPLPDGVETSPGLRRVLRRLLEKDPAIRYGSAREVLVDLADLV